MDAQLRASNSGLSGDWVAAVAAAAQTSDAAAATKRKRSGSAGGGLRFGEQRRGRHATLEVEPAMIRVVVKLAGAHGGPVALPVENVHARQLRDGILERGLRGTQAIQRYAGVHVMRAVLEDVVEDTAHALRHHHVDGRGDEAEALLPLIALVEPGDFGMRVLDIDDPAHDAVEREERQHEAGEQRPGDGVIAVDGPE